MRGGSSQAVYSGERQRGPLSGKEPDGKWNKGKTRGKEEDERRGTRRAKRLRLEQEPARRWKALRLAEAPIRGMDGCAVMPYTFPHLEKIPIPKSAPRVQELTGCPQCPQLFICRFSEAGGC